MHTLDLIKKLNKKIGSTVPYRLLFDIIVIINDYLYEEIINDRSVSIHGLGNFNQIVPKSRKIWSRWQNKYVMSKPTKKLVFRPDQKFKKLIRLKQDELKIPLKKTK
jgi:nucleoid DNA-binding protein